MPSACVLKVHTFSANEKTFTKHLTLYNFLSDYKNSLIKTTKSKTMGSQPVRRPNQNLSASELRAVNSLHRQHQALLAQPRFALLLQSNSNPNHSFRASAWGANAQEAVNSFFGEGAEGEHSRRCVRVVSVHACEHPSQASPANRVN